MFKEIKEFFVESFDISCHLLLFIQSNPQYQYKYQVSDEKEQTYIAHDQARDGAAVTGQYSYVDPYGSLIIVKYTADDVNGYQETREVQEGFVTTRWKKPEAPKPAPKPRPAPKRPNVDLVAKIISQLTPFIKTTVSDSLGARQASTRVVSVPRTVVQAVPVVSQVTSTASLFGEDGENRITVDTPNFNFDKILF